MKSTERVKRFRERNPWYRLGEYAKRRCTDENHKSYKFYGERGIKYLLTIKQVEELWKRDNAHLLNNPSLDRENPDKHYVFDNCRFIELIDNVSARRMSGEAKHKIEDWEE